MPTFICEAIFKNCTLANVGVAAALAKCSADEMANCGHINPDTFVPVTSSSSSSASSTASNTASATGGSTPSSSSSAAAAATMMAMAGQYGTGLLAAGAAAAFGMLI
jgi:hypothetical protein